MKIGILTYHRSHNYGALLQAVALREVLMRQGAQVFYVDYWPEYHKDMYRLFNQGNFWSVGTYQKIKYLISLALRSDKILLRRKRFSSFIAKYIQPYCRPLSSEMDYIVFGSDQIWRKQSGLGDKLNPVYFGEWDFGKAQLVSYAASMGIIKLNDSDRSDIKRWLNSFKGVSVREESLKKELENIGIKDVSLTLDPTLLLNKEEWVKILSIKDKDSEKQPYVVVYDLMRGSFAMEAIKKFATDHGYEVRVLTGSVEGYMPQKGYAKTAGPKEMVKIIAQSECVFTSSFHGLVFSIIFNKPFYAAFKQNAGRAESLLSIIGHQERLLSSGISVIPNLKEIDYDKVNERLGNLREHSLNFIKRTILNEGR